MEKEDSIKITKLYLLCFKNQGFPYEECVASIERNIYFSRNYLEHSLNNGCVQEEFNLTLIYHYLKWDDSKWALNLLSNNLEMILKKPKFKKLF